MKAIIEPWGYKAMLILLQARSEAQPTGDVAKLLGEFALAADGKPSDAMRDEWNAAVKEAMASVPDQMTQLHLL